jgi:threonyl-tRNA synthetase
MRVRGFTQDDAHIICTSEQIVDEIRRVLKFSLNMWNSFGFDKISFYVSTKPDKSVGNDQDWELATKALKDAINSEDLEYTLDEGGGAFYGPKIDFKVTDALGREWQVSTIQFDFNLPERFDMSYTDHDGKKKRPFMIHRALLGSLERFFGILIEHYSAGFPVWLAPNQVTVIPIRPEFNDYAEEIASKLLTLEYRVKVDISDSNMNKKIKVAQQAKTPYMIILGEQEQKNNCVSIRFRNNKQQNMITFDEFLNYLDDVVENKKLM